MNCWKSINLNKEFGTNRIIFMSFLIGLLAFIFLYLTLSIVHGVNYVNESGIYAFIIALILLPPVHLLLHILPLIVMKKRMKFCLFKKYKRIPSLTYYTDAPLTKKASLTCMLAPTIFITVPGIIASCLFIEYYVYFLLLTSIHLGMSFLDFLNLIHIVKAPKESYIENVDEGFDILLKDAK